MVIPCPIPWLNSDLGNKKGVCRPGTSCPLEVGGVWVGDMEEIEPAGKGQGNAVLSSYS